MLSALFTMCRQDASECLAGGGAVHLKNPVHTLARWRSPVHRDRAPRQLGSQPWQSLDQTRGGWGRIEAGVGWPAGGGIVPLRGEYFSNKKVCGTVVWGHRGTDHCGKDVAREVRFRTAAARGAHGFEDGAPLAHAGRSHEGRPRCIFAYVFRCTYHKRPAFGANFCVLLSCSRTAVVGTFCKSACRAPNSSGGSPLRQRSWLSSHA